MNITLFGAAFDPPHNGHTTMAQTVLTLIPALPAQHLADEVWYVPCAQHPFHKEMSEAKDRIAMLKYVVTPHTNIYMYELEHDKPSYSIDTLSHAAETHPEHTFSWLIGSDNLPNFHKWYDYEQLLKEFHVFVYPRKGYPFEPLYDGMVALRDVPEIDISSTMVRDHLKHGQSIEHMVDPRVSAFIRANGLYENGL